MVDFINNLLSTSFADHGYLIIFVAMLIENASGLGSLIPGDTILLLAGFYARGTHTNLVGLIFFGVLGAVIGDNISYFIGRKWGKHVVSWLKGRWDFLHRRLTNAQGYFHKHGGKTVLFGRNVAVVRTYVPLLAGIGKMPYGKFFVYNIIGATLQISVFLILGFFFGQYRSQIEHALRNTGLVLVVVAIFIGLFYYHRQRVLKRRR